MFRAALPDVPNLQICASASTFEGVWISATGIGETIADAQVRHDAERAERRHSVRLRRITSPGAGLRGEIIGVAAGTDDAEQVRQRAVNELIERWACNGWWNGSVSHRSPGRTAQDAFDEARRNWPRNRWRRTGLRQVDAGDERTVCVAWSCDGYGNSLCFGTACLTRADKAAQKALIELYQMEFGLSVIRHRDDHGVALSAREKGVLDRARRLTYADVADRLEDGPNSVNGFAGREQPSVQAVESFKASEDDHLVVFTRWQAPPGNDRAAIGPGGFTLYGDV